MQKELTLIIKAKNDLERLKKDFFLTQKYSKKYYFYLREIEKQLVYMHFLISNNE